MEHDVVLTRKDGSGRRFHIYGRPMPNVGEIVTLPIDGRLIKARIGKVHGAPSPRAEERQLVDHLDAAEI
jgi:hypothetical protein